MANRRMFSKNIVSTDRFMSMPLSAQALYFHYNMNADDDGFVSNPVAIKRQINANDDDFSILAARGFIIPFKSKIIVVADWRINNQIRKDRYIATIYQKEFASLQIQNNKYIRTNIDENKYLEGAKF
ncbi:MAG: hypothetical protein Q4F12_04370 [Erysipelotrichaceae bacterium]|nr:hypothetical protein [Erysipelotrichaceae bacterium]